MIERMSLMMHNAETRVPFKADSFSNQKNEWIDK